MQASLRRWGRGGALAAGYALFVACTITNDGFEPALVDSAPAQPVAEAGPEQPAASDPAPNACDGGTCETPAPVESVEPDCSGPDCAGAEVPVTLAPSCDDGLQNGDETGADCGGGCPPCADGSACSVENDCVSRVCGGGVCSVPACDDSTRNGAEADVDCGSSCGEPCGAGRGCTVDADCAAGTFCAPGGSVCVPVACDDGIQNGAELLADCGGGSCPGCPDESPCAQGTDCVSGVCAAGACASPTCGDGVRNQDETGVDCGGDCDDACPVGAGCTEAADCQTRVCGTARCNGLDRCCQAPSCNDDVRNGSEVGTDCGNAACGACPLGQPCTADGQCGSRFCQAGQCRDSGSCTDGIRNGRESSIDCGGNRCGGCGDRVACGQDTDCISGDCAGGVCSVCGDGVRNGTETDVDCGGTEAACPRCNPIQRCGNNDDCVEPLLCVAGACGT